MKKLFIFALISLFALAGNADSYKIIVNFPDATHNNEEAYLTNYDSGDTLATATIRGKRCTFMGEVDKSYYARLICAGKRLELVVENSNIIIDFATGEVAGSPLNAYMTTLEGQFAAAKTEADLLPILYKAYTDNKDNGIGPWAFFQYLMSRIMMGDMTLADLTKEQASMPAEYMQSKRISSLSSVLKAQDNTAVGKMFTNFTITQEDGKTIQLSDYVGKGSYTVVDFWASWCGPCRREIPNIKKMYEQYNGKGMTFLGVAVWDNPADTHKAMDALQIPWPVMIANKKISEPTNIYGILGIPHIIIFDPEGRIISRGLQGAKLAEAVDSCMAK